ncbi:major facilitator superfamily transporter [Zymoseptoria tritici IPO323]|uniref:Major facilitator superfamily transporter n=1 Tax=Zymoseptoria tritici (strain CBS 115943 / IPO323) TaxID=336722 RepID=F9XLH4_ZYMTI|nr:major facilitator superfamily transporter [Zymoseptoria tritici IPO323]EGP83893.1 major facilitator superfamily transporter [Zymoseptoria tritici IPO323]
MARLEDDEKSIPTARNTPAESIQDDSAGLATIELINTNNGRPECFKSTTQEILFVLSATMAIAMSAFLTGAVTVTSASIGRSLDMTTAQITWITSALSLSSGAFLLPFGRVADLFGRKSLFVGSLFLFSIFCLAAGFSHDAMTMDVLNGVIGLFTASAVPPAVGILGVAYSKPSKRKNAAFACFSAGNPLGFAFGTIFGGVATQIVGWRGAFYLVALVFLIFTVVAFFCVPADFTAKEPLTFETLKKFDFLGTVLTIAGIGMFSAALTMGSTDGWTAPYVLSLLLIGLALIVTFIFWEMWFEYPLMPMGIWKDRNFSLVLAILVLGFSAFTMSSFFLSLYFQDVWHLSALMVAVYLLPMATNGVLVNIFAGWALHRISNKILMCAATLSFVLAFLLFALATDGQEYWKFYFPGLLLVVVGADMEFNVTNMYVMSSMPPEQQSTAGGIFQTVTKLCMTIGLALATAVFNSVQKRPALSGYWEEERQPYAAVYWSSFAFAMVSLLLVPLLTIGTQGGKERCKDGVVDDGDVGGQTAVDVTEVQTHPKQDVVDGTRPCTELKV